MIKYPPTAAKITSHSVGNGIQLELEFDEHRRSPRAVWDWLVKAGWSQNASRPDTDEPLFQNPSKTDTECGYYTWEQAVAFEYYWMMTIGGNDS